MKAVNYYSIFCDFIMRLKNKTKKKQQQHLNIELHYLVGIFQKDI